MGKNINLINENKIDNFKLNKKLTSHNLLEISECHKKIFTDSIATKLGDRYLKKMFKWFLVSNDRFLFSYSYNNKTIGYIGGAKGSGSTSGMIQFAFWEALLSILARPYIIFNRKFFFNKRIILKNIKKRVSFKKKINTKINDNHKSLGLVVIGVLPDYRRNKIGEKLLDIFYQKCNEYNYDTCHLNVESKNYKAVAFYQKHGWIVKSKTKNTYRMIKIIKK